MKVSVIFFKTSILFSLITLHLPTYSQETRKHDFVSVKAYSILRGTPSGREKDSCTYFTTAIVTNNSNSTIVFWIFNCSWPVNNWLVDNDSIYVRYRGCNSNFPVEIKLLPHKSIDFYGGVVTIGKQDLIDKYFRLGFIYFETEKQAWSYFEGKTHRRDVEKIWSNKIKLEKYAYRYEVE
jgi:hypothetical protein